MKTMSWVMGLLALLTSCKHNSPQPGVGPTEINMLVVDESRQPLQGINVSVLGTVGSYFTGSRKDTSFARLVTDLQGKAAYKTNIDNKWYVWVVAVGYSGTYTYNDVRYEGDIDKSTAEIKVGQVSSVTAVLFNR